MHAGDTHRDAQIPVDSPGASRSPGLALLMLCAAQLMLVVDITAVNIALPALGADLGMRGSEVTWVITSYVIAFGGLMLLGGRLADLVGRRRMLLVGLLVFTLGSLGCGIAGSGVELLVARAVQGAGAALVSPAALASVATLFDGPARVRALGVWAGVGAAGFVGGLILSGALTQGPGWRWVFLINLPICALLLVALPRLLPPDRPRGRERVDLAGALVATTAMGSLVYGLTGIGDEGGIGPDVVAALVLTAIAAVAFVLVEARHSSPLIAPRVLRQRPVFTGLGVMLAASAAMLSIFFLASMYAQHVLRLSPLETGVIFLPSAVATMVSAHAAGHLITHHGARAAAVAGFLATAAGTGILSQVGADTSAWGHLVPALVLTSLGLGPAVVVATSTTLAQVADADAGIASGIVNSGHEVGGAFGIALLGATLGSGVAGSGAAPYASGFLGMAVGACMLAVAAGVAVPPLRPHAELLHHGHQVPAGAEEDGRPGTP